MSNLKDVIVTLPIKEGGCAHLQEKILAINEGGEAWWWFSSLPLHIEVESKLYVVCEDYLRGFFIVEGFEPEPIQGKYLMVDDGFQVFLCDWTPLKEPIPMKGFRGFQYAKKHYT